MRSAEQILQRIADVESRDFLGTERGDLVEALPFEHAQPFLKDGVTPEQWAEAHVTDPLKPAREYVAFAWGKANNCRGISASRSIDHFRSWLWLAGIDDFDALADREYEFYGKPILVVVCEALGVAWRSLDDGDWTNAESAPCHKPSDNEIARLVDLAQPIKDALNG